MEFAETVPVEFLGTDDSWPLPAPRSFLLSVSKRQENGVSVAHCADYVVWSDRDPGPLWLARNRAGPRGRNLSNGHIGGESERLLLSRDPRAVYVNHLVVSPDWRAAITIGFFGSFTTFSSFGWETMKMAEDGEWLKAAIYVFTSVVFGLLLTFLGIRIASRF